jgi:pimeloyl-ACP methyl ester carboxylesterase
MSTITQVGPLSAAQARLSAVFLHGLGGDHRDTWSAGDSFWPKWLADDVEGLAVYSIGYDASPTAWFGGAMPLLDRATNVLKLLETEGVGEAPIVFICHSLGGLVVKQMLRNGNDYGVESWRRIREQTRRVFFLATPHAGSQVATYVGALGKIFRPTKAIEDLAANAAPLRDLNLWYRNNAKALGTETTIYYETRATHGVTVVNETSADLGVSGVVPIPIDADHLSICKPRSRSDLVYKSIEREIKQLVVEPRVFTSPLQELLWDQIDRCKKHDVKFRSTHVLLALFKVPESFARACCNRIQVQFSKDLVERLENFVERQAENPEELGYVPVQLSRYPLVVVARNNARTDRRERVDERDLFLAFLGSESGTSRWARTRLGKLKFKKLLDEANMPVGQTRF